MLAAGQRRTPAASSSQSVTRSVLRDDAAPVMPVAGPSTLHHLGLTIEGTSMGWDGQWSPPPSNVALQPSRPPRADGSTAPFLMSGADLYRISCRPCHKPDGSGAPPEINSLKGPVQSASVVWMTRRMKDMGRPVDSAFIRQLASSTEADLRKRLRTGGHTMPSFDHLSDQEIAVLRPYLDELSDVPGAAGRRRDLSVPVDRVGELLVKGTCHICHDATGESPSPTALNRVVPSLASISRQKTGAQVVSKVHVGASIPVGSTGVASRGRMPVFTYLTEAEAAAAFMYLSRHPPR